MRKISIDFARPGMKVARPVYNSSGQTLLNSNVILTEKYITRLKDLDIPALYIDDGLLPELEVDDVINEETRVSAITNVKKILNNESGNGISKNIIIPAPVFNCINEIMDELLNNRRLMVNLTDIRSSDDYVFGHSVNVCVLSLITGIALGYDRRKLTNLAMGAMFHDIGKIKVPKEILNKPGKLTKEEFETIKKHSQWGFEILKANPNISITSTVAVYQHHERYNGQGYPQGLEGRQIHEFAAIIGIVDMYDAIVSDRVYRKAFPAHEAFELIAASGDYLFNFDIVKAFIDHVAAYPAGTVAELSSGEIVVVMETKIGMSLRPRVKVLVDAKGGVITGNPVYIDLTEKTNVLILRILEEDEIKTITERISKASN